MSSYPVPIRISRQKRIELDETKGGFCNRTDETNFSTKDSLQ
jgi:hypothetical protein